MEVVFRLDVVQMYEPLLPRLLRPNPGKARIEYKPAHLPASTQSDASRRLIGALCLAYLL